MVNYEILNIKEAAELLKVNPEVLRRLSISGKIPAAFKIGKLWRYRKNDLIGASNEQP